MIRISFILGVFVAALAGPAEANELALTPGEIDNLGIRFVQPAPATDVGGIEATARVVLPPAADTIISTPQDGLVVRLAANAGDEVAAGQVLAELKSPEFISLQRQLLDAYNAQRLAGTEQDRDTRLHAEGIISARRLEETRTRKAIADAALEEQRQLLGFVGMQEEDLRSLERRQQLQVSLLLRAPFDGVIADRLAVTGQRLDAMSPIYRLIDMSELWLEINVPQEQLAFAAAGARVIATGSSGEWNGIVVTAGRSIDPGTQTAVVRARLDAGAVGFRPGQFVAARVLAGEGDAGAFGAFAIPAVAVTRSGDQAFVFVRTDAGVVATPVEVVSITGARAFVTGRLREDDAVAISGIAALKAVWLAGGEEEPQ